MNEMYRSMAGPGQQMATLSRFSAAVLASDNVVPVVLEFEQPPVAVYKQQNPKGDSDKYQAELTAAHQAFIKLLASLGIHVQLGQTPVVKAEENGSTTVNMPHDFTHIFNGIGVLMPGRMVSQVAQMAGVRAVSLNHERVYLNLDKSVPFLGAPQIWERFDAQKKNIKGDGVVVAIIDTGKVCA